MLAKFFVDFFVLKAVTAGKANVKQEPTRKKVPVEFPLAALPSDFCGWNAAPPQKLSEKQWFFLLVFRFWEVFLLRKILPKTAETDGAA